MKIPTVVGEVMDRLWYGGTVTIKWFWGTEGELETLSWGWHHAHSRFFACTWWKRSMSILASAFHDVSSARDTYYEHPRKICIPPHPQKKHRNAEILKQRFSPWFASLIKVPEMFSWKMTLVPLRKFFPMMKTSCPPVAELLWRLFFRISGTPAGWAAHADKSIIVTVTQKTIFYLYAKATAIKWIMIIWNHLFI